jgi:hypothetical protein
MGSSQDEIYLEITLRLTSQISLSLYLRKFQSEIPTILPSYIWRYSRDCAHDWGRSSVCLLQSWEQELWKSQDQSSSCSHGHIDREKTYLVHLKGQIPLHIRDRLNNRCSGCLCKLLCNSNQHLGCPYR